MSRVLVVDDEEQVRTVLATVLEKRGHEPATAESGPLALAAYAAFHPELVLLDLHMPGMNGLDVLQKLITWEPKLPAVILTGVVDEAIARQAIAKGACNYITKPIDMEKLDTVIEISLLVKNLGV